MGRRRKIEEVDGFLKLTVKVKHQINGEEKTFIQALNHSLSPQDLKFTIEDDLFCAYLATFDPDSFRVILEDIRNQTRITDFYKSEGLCDPVSSLLEQILSIGSYGIRYGKRIYIGYADERKVSDRKVKESTRGIHYYTRDHQFSHNRNPIPKGRENTIVCGDSEDVLRSFPDNCIDLIVTSPPYNFGMEYDKTDDGVDWNAYLDKLFRVFTEGIRVLTFGGRFIVNVQPLFSDYIPLHHLISSFFMQQKMIWKGEILWEKNNYNCKYTSWGSWKSPSSPYLKYTWEFIEVFCKGDLKKPGRKEDIDITDEEFKSWVVAKWSIGPERRMKQYDHPAMFPEELIERCMKLFSYKGDIVLDPFSGAGTTATVATRLGRRYIGIDVSEEYCATARERIAKERKSGIQSNLI
ncbi:MAG TPA: site-specific DNA-methyltransferase [Methanospirillum sp.]|uniref:DNA-methyltransferase n=1 Tax=Methanospirillum sp. TaxID=45200 RepID=UPI002BACBA22|nr:site-specific DNA-methyltransferase [Methanospirillum sp.]HWQ63525.1 site-specific DNA-methyltransferase [Methanospirillum sp.]